jgi:hypothetical protein
MRRLPRILLNVATVTSLVLCVGTCVLWARSGRRSDYAAAAPTWRHFGFTTVPGGLKLTTWPNPAQPGGLVFASYEYDVRNAQGGWVPRPAARPSVLGFDLRPLRFSYQATPDRGAFELIVPLWFLAAALVALPAASAFRVIRVGRRVPGNRCAACGYDLRATPGRCPECGSMAVATEANA